MQLFRHRPPHWLRFAFSALDSLARWVEISRSLGVGQWLADALAAFRDFDIS
jgi:hypothetical protein